MELDQNLNEASTQVVVGSPAVSQGAETHEMNAERKGGNGMLLGLILCLILAVGGIGFGIWAMMDGNSQINSLKQSNSELQAKLSGVNTINNGGNGNSDNKMTVNPVIAPSDSNKQYKFTFDSSTTVDTRKSFRIEYSDGVIESCSVGNYEDVKLGQRAESDSCTITGLSGEVYKIVRFGAGHDDSHDNIGFIMTDGSVWYAPLAESAELEEIKVKKLGINGRVVDVASVSVHNAPDAYGATVFILDNGSIVEYSESLLQQ